MNTGNKLRLAHYNILKGGEDRLDDISKAISLLDADICGISEAVGWQDDVLFWEDYGKKIGFDFFNLAKANSKYNIAVFSKYPIQVTSIIEGIKHVIMKIKILDERFSNIQMFLVHLSPVCEDDRLSEISKILKTIAPDDHAIIMGDFNSLSANDPYNRDELLNFFKDNDIKKYGDDHLRFDVISKLELSGMYDLMKFLKKKWDYTVPTSSNIDVHHSEKLRIDYAFVTKSLVTNCTNYQIAKGDIYERSSDHYPIYFDLEI